MTNPQPAAAYRAIPSVTSVLLDSFRTHARRIGTDLTGYILAHRLDAAEASILAAMNDLRELRLHLRQMRALARAEMRRAA